MNSFRFANPEWFHLTWLVAFMAALLVFWEVRGRAALERLVSVTMQSHLVTRPSLRRRLLSITMLVAALMLIVFALMRPQWGQQRRQVARIDSRVMICLDVSRSMLAEDVVPNRLERAKAELDDLLGFMDQGQHVGLIAFAGKATVVCPMTGDFGFLRLILREMKPNTVGLGGSKIGLALEKAIEGFGDVGDFNRVILLITDGEDHDSFPLDAAQKAKERGVRIVCVGFGDEQGSKIEITDPDTGVRSFVKDRDGNDVITRLDGEMLRDVALSTNGAYIPAGTGALDLQEIYDRHVASLFEGTTSEQEQIIRNDAFQWFLGLAFLTLVGCLHLAAPAHLKRQALTRPLIGSPSQNAKVAGLLLALAVVGLANPGRLRADVSTGAADAEATINEAADVRGGPESVESGRGTVDDETGEDDTLTARQLYNLGLPLVSRDPDEARRLFEKARMEADSDGEVRYRSLYNLGWLEVRVADDQLAEDPGAALESLKKAATRFQEAIRVRPKSDDARYNLEVVARRMVELEDSLLDKDAGDLTKRLDEIINAARTSQANLASLTHRELAVPYLAQQRRNRSEMREVTVTQRQEISELQRFVDEISRELESLGTQDETTSDEERYRASQLAAMRNPLERAIQRMTKARALSRRWQMNRAFIRWSNAINDLNDARDILRDPVEVLGVLVADQQYLYQLTEQKVNIAGLLLSEDPNHVEVLEDQDFDVHDNETEQENAEVRAANITWLSADYLADQQRSLTARTERLLTLFKQLSEQHASTNNDNAAIDVNARDSVNAKAAEMRKTVAQMVAATPYVGSATEKMQDAFAKLEQDQFSDAMSDQAEAHDALKTALEQFFDVRRLIEAIYASQLGINQTIAEPDPTSERWTELVNESGEQIVADLARLDRLAKMIDEARLQLDASNAPAAENQGPKDDNSQPNPADVSEGDEAETNTAGEAPKDLSQSDVDAERLRLAMELVGEVMLKVKTVGGEIEGWTTDRILEVAKRNDAIKASGEAIEKIEALRRLFFSIVEHLRETGQRQADLMDDTTEASSKPVDELTDQVIGPLNSRQAELQRITQEISLALAEQANAASQAEATSKEDPGASDDISGKSSSEPSAARFKAASEKVKEAASQMEAAVQRLRADRNDDVPDSETDSTLQAAREAQQNALVAIAEALQELNQQPPEQNNEQQNKQQQQQQQQDEQQPQPDPSEDQPSSSDQDESSPEANQQRHEQQQRQRDGEQLLQLIRDREAQRRRQQERQRISTGGGRTDRDW